MEACPGCGATLPPIDGAAHAYVGASSACWTIFAELNVSLPPAPLRRLVTDAYMVQHPGVPERRSTQSVGLHLVGLCLVLEHGLPETRLSAMLARILRTPPAWRWLEPPEPNGELTITEVGATVGSTAYPAAVDDYVRSIWSAWSAHRQQVERWSRPFAG